MKILGTIGWLVAGLLFFILFSEHACNGDHEMVSDTVQAVYSIRDTNKYAYQSVNLKPETAYLEIPIFITDTNGRRPFVVDSQAVVTAFFTKKYYRDTLCNDSNIMAWQEDSVYMNEIYWRNFHYEMNKPLLIHQTTIINRTGPERKLFAGFGVDAGFYYFLPSIGPELLYLDKKNRAYRFGAHYNGKWRIETSLYFNLGGK